MMNKKIVAQVKFILCFHSAFWQNHFQWFLSAPKWMDNMPSNNRIGGCHAPEMVRRLIMIMRKLTSLKGSFDSDTRFANWQAAVAALPSPEDRKLLVLAPAHAPWRRIRIRVHRRAPAPLLRPPPALNRPPPPTATATRARALTPTPAKTRNFLHIICVAEAYDESI